jgi:hypothetical protein
VPSAHAAASLSLGHPRGVEEILDHSSELTDLPFDDYACPLSLVAAATCPHHAERRLYCADGLPQFVRNGRDERILMTL